jgi:3-oxoacyl-[acyl-carrier protein] reductase
MMAGEGRIMKSVKGKVVIVTGSAANIGRATVLSFAKAGAKVVVNAKDNVAGGEAVAAEIKRDGGEAIFVQADLSSEAEADKLFDETLKAFGTVDVLINNAGGGGATPFLESGKQDWLRALDDNLIDTVLCSQRAARIMLAKKDGVILNTSSIRALDYGGSPRTIAYSAAKAAVDSLTKTLAKQLAPHIRVNAVAPGFVKTPMYDSRTKEQQEVLVAAMFIGRWLAPQEIADAFLYLATADGVTGEVLMVDGGYSLKMP